MTRSCSVVVLVLTLFCAPAGATIYLEVTPAGEAADGLESTVRVGEVTEFEVWISGDTLDTQLFNIQFDLGREGPGEWDVLTLGTIDPDGVGTGNPSFNNSGQLMDGAIHDARFIEHPFASLDATPWRIYADFTAVGLEPGGRLVAHVDSHFSSGLGTQPVEVIGVTAVPEPSLIGWGLVVGWLGMRRRW